MVSEINGPKIGGVSPLDQGSVKIDKSNATTATQSASKTGDVVTLTDLAAKLQSLTQSVADLPVADQKKISEFRNLVESGNYTVDSKAVAEKLANIESMLATLPTEE